MNQPPIRKCPYALIVMPKGYIAIVDKSLWPKVRKFHWYAHISRGRGRKAGLPYARANVHGRRVYLHRFVTNCPEGFQPDHKNHQTLDCRVENLEIITNAENNRRRRCVKKGKIS
jgi:HNH endonuclease